MHKLYAAASATIALTAGIIAATNEPPVQAVAAQEAQQQQCRPYKQLYAHKHWRDATPLGGENPCPLGESRVAKLKEEFHTYRQYRRIARLPGLHEGDPYLEYLPIPAYIVACETHGHYGKGRWNVWNTSGSGAFGPAQLMPIWNPPTSIRSSQDKLAYWQATVRAIGTSWECA